MDRSASASADARREDRSFDPSKQEERVGPRVVDRHKTKRAACGIKERRRGGGRPARRATAAVRASELPTAAASFGGKNVAAPGGRGGRGVFGRGH